MEQWLFNIATKKASTDGAKALVAFVVSFLARPEVTQHLSMAGVSISVDPKAMQAAIAGGTALGLGYLHDYLKLKYPNQIKF